MASPPTGKHLCGVIHGRHPFPYAQRRPDCKEIRVYSHRHQHGRHQVCPGDVGRENVSAEFWLLTMNSIRYRGVEDILIACVDGLTGFTSTIEAVYPKSSSVLSTRSAIPPGSFPADGRPQKSYAAIDEPTAAYELDIFEYK